MNTKLNENAVEQAKVEDLSPVSDVSGGANGMPRISDKNGTVAGDDMLPVR